MLSSQASTAGESPPVTYETVTGQVAGDLLGPGGQLRVLTRYHREPGEPEFCVQVAADLSRVNQSLSNLRRVFLFVIAIGLVLTGVASWLIAKRSLAPLNAIHDDSG